MNISPPELSISQFIARWDEVVLPLRDEAAWEIVSRCEAMIRDALAGLGHEFETSGEIAVHRTAEIEPGAIVKPPAIIGAGCFIAATAYLRGGIFLDEGCTIGPACELKTSLMFRGSKLAHLNFVGDSILGEQVNVEAGAMIANYRNELDEKTIRFRYRGAIVQTQVDKFGALIGDRTRIGANAVIAPGAMLDPGSRVQRLSLVDMGVSP